MRIPTLFIAAGMSLSLYSAASAHEGRPQVPADYPSHLRALDCGSSANLQSLRDKLDDYNLIRLQVATVLRTFADKYELSGPTRKNLLAFAQNFEQMQEHLPDPDPDSDAFRNFDFKVGLAFTALTVFLNTEDESLAGHFYSDRENPGSELGVYLAALDNSRNDYMTALAHVNSTPADSGVSCEGE